MKHQSLVREEPEELFDDEPDVVGVVVLPEEADELFESLLVEVGVVVLVELPGFWTSG